MIVADAGVVVTALADDGLDGAQARSRVFSEDVAHAPHLMDVEVSAVLRRLALVEDVIPEERARHALQDLADLPVVRYAHGPLLGRAWELRHNLRPYDGVYVALAEALEAVLLTTDQRLANAPGRRCSVEVLEVA